MGFKLFKNGNEVEVYHTDIGYDKFLGTLVVSHDGDLSILLNAGVMMGADGARAVADLLDEWEDNPTLHVILGDYRWI